MVVIQPFELVVHFLQAFEFGFGVLRVAPTVTDEPGIQLTAKVILNELSILIRSAEPQLEAELAVVVRTAVFVRVRGSPARENLHRRRRLAT